MALEDYLKSDMQYVNANDMLQLAETDLALSAESYVLKKKDLTDRMKKYASDSRYQNSLIQLASRNERLRQFNTDYTMREFASLPEDVKTANANFVETVKEQRRMSQVKLKLQGSVTEYREFNMALCQLETLLTDKPPAPELKSAVERLIRYIKAQKRMQQPSHETMVVAHAVVLPSSSMTPAKAVVSDKGAEPNVETATDVYQVANVTSKLNTKASLKSLTRTLNETYWLLGGKIKTYSGDYVLSNRVRMYKRTADLSSGGIDPGLQILPLVLAMYTGILGLEFFLIGITTSPIIPVFALVGGVCLAVSLTMLAIASVIAEQPRTDLAKEMFAVADVASKVEKESKIQSRYDGSLVTFRQYKATFSGNAEMTERLNQFETHLESMASSGVEKRAELVSVLADVNALLAQKNMHAAKTVAQKYNTMPSSFTLFTPKPLDEATSQLYADVQILADTVKTLGVDAKTANVEESIHHFAMAT